MAFTERLALIIDAKTSGAQRELKSLNTEIKALQTGSTQASGATDGLTSALGSARQMMSGLGVATAGAAAAIALHLGVESVKAADDLNKKLLQSHVIFGDATSAVETFAKSAAQSLGLSERAAIAATDTFGGLFVELGVGHDQAEQMSQTLTKLGVDLASFGGTSNEQAFTALQKGLEGQTRGLKAFNVVIDAASVKQEALRQGLISSEDSITPLAQALATYQLILQSTSLQQGDFARTSGTLSNQSATLKASLDDLQVAIGQKLIPALDEAVQKLNGIVSGSSDSGQALHSLASGAEDAHSGITKVVDVVPGLDHLSRLADPLHSTDEALGDTKSAFQGVADAIGTTTKEVNLNTTAWKDVENAVEGARSGLNSQLAIAQPIEGSLSRITLAVGEATAAYQALDAATRSALQGASQGLLAAAGAVAAAGPILHGSAAPPIQVGQLVQSAQDALDAYLHSLSSATSGGVSKGLQDSKDPAKELADYLGAQFQEQMQKLGNVFKGLSSSLSFADAKANLDDAAKKLSDLQAEASTNKGSIGQQQSLVGQLLVQSTQITPEEQLAIEQAEKNLEDVKARFYGLATQQVAAPGSSFLGPTTISVAGPKASLAELQVAEDQLAKAKADAVGPTQELKDAEDKLAQLRDRQKDLPGLIADAQRNLTKAQQALVDAKRAEVDAGRDLLYQGPEFVDQYKQIARQAGLTETQINNLVGSLTALKQAAAPFEGLVDTFGNGYLFQTPDQAAATRAFVSGLSGIPTFAEGGYVPGPNGAPRLVIAHGGEAILNRSQQAAWGSGPVSIVVPGAGDPDVVAERVYRKLVSRQGRNGSLGFN